MLLLQLLRRRLHSRPGAPLLLVLLLVERVLLLLLLRSGMRARIGTPVRRAPRLLQNPQSMHLSGRRRTR